MKRRYKIIISVVSSLALVLTSLMGYNVFSNMPRVSASKGIISFALSPVAPVVEKVSDPSKRVTNPILIKHLKDNGVNQDYVEKQRVTPTSEVYKDLLSGLTFSVFSMLPSRSVDGKVINPSWQIMGNNKYSSNFNLLCVDVSNNVVVVTTNYDQSDGRKKGDKLTFTPELYHAGKMVQSSSPTLLSSDPFNANYYRNTLKSDFSNIATRYLRIIEGKLLGYWIFDKNPNADVLIRYNQSGDFRLSLSQIVEGKNGKLYDISAFSDNDTEVIPKSIWDKITYPVKVYDASVFSPDASPESTSVDGNVRWATATAVGDTWDNAHDGVDNDMAAFDSGASQSNIDLQAGTTSNQWQYLLRGFYLFDTSALPDSANISATDLYLYVTTKLDGFTGSMEVVSSNPISNTALAANDYYTSGNTSFATKTVASIGTSQYNYWSFNASGLASVNTTGLTKLGTRLSYDRADTPPVWSSAQDSYVTTYNSEQGTGYQPILIVTYEPSIPDYNTGLAFSEDRWDGYGQLMKISDSTYSYFYSDGGDYYQPGRIMKRDYTVATQTWGDATVVYASTPYCIPLVGGGIIGTRIYLFFSIYNMGGAGTRLGLLWMRSTDLTGSSWSATTNITSQMTLAHYNAYGRIVATDTAGTYLQMANEYLADLSSWRATVLRTTDSGDNWTAYSTIYSGTTHWDETALAYLGNGTIIALLRNDSGGVLGQSVSYNNGATWSTIANTNLGQTTGTGPKMGHAIYSPSSKQIQVAFWDRTDGTTDNSQLLITRSDNTVLTHPANWPATTTLLINQHIDPGYPSFVETVTDNNYFGIFSTGTTANTSTVYYFTANYSSGLSTVYSPTANTGGWDNPTYAYSSNGQYATRALGYSSTNNASSGSANWTDPSNAYANGGGYAYITAANPSASSVWGNYGFSLTGYTIDQVRVRYDAWSAGVSSNGTYAYKLPGSDGDVVGTIAVYPSTPASKWMHVDEFIPNNSDGIVIITNNDYQMFYATSNFTVPAGSIIHNVSIVFTTSDNADGTNKCTGQLKVNGTVYVNGVNNEPPNIPTFTQFTSNWTQNPDTSANWTVDEVNGVTAAAEIQQFGVKASDATPDVNVGAVYLRVDYTPPVEYDDRINVDVSWDSGGTWSASQNSTLTSSETTYWDNVTGVTSWTAAKLADGVFRVRALAQSVGNAEVVRLDWIPVEVTAHDTSNLTHTFSSYGISLTGDNITKVEVGTEAFAASGEKIGIEVSWDAGGTWSASQNTTALSASDPEAVTYLDFTSATTWLPAHLMDATFKVRITYVSNGYYGQISLDWLPVRITYTEGAAPVNYSANQTTYDFGVVQLSSTNNTTGNWITFTNSSTVTTNISVRILASTWTATAAGWTHSDTAAGANTAAMKANSSNSTAWSSAVFIKYNPPFNEIKQSVPIGANVVSGLSLLAPTSVTNGNTNNNTVRFSFYASSP